MQAKKIFFTIISCLLISSTHIQSVKIKVKSIVPEKVDRSKMEDNRFFSSSISESA